MKKYLNRILIVSILLAFFVESCSYTCKSCYADNYRLNQSNNQCATCSQINFRSLNLISHQCSCIDGYFDIKQPKCQICSYECKTCINSSASCISCDQKNHRQLSNYNCPCVQRYYDNNQAMCLQCVSNCLLCDSLICKQCQEGFYLSNGICKKCNSICKSCIQSFLCKSCYNNYILSQNQLCFCPNQYIQITNHQCIKKQVSNMSQIITLIVCGTSSIFIFFFLRQIYRKYKQQEFQEINFDTNSTQCKNTLQKIEENKISGDQKCSICLCLNPNILTSCKHYYHLKCLIKCCQKSQVCPNCKTQNFQSYIKCQNCQTYIINALFFQQFWFNNSRLQQYESKINENKICQRCIQIIKQS